tara:strand:- start:240 stop:725 length:486 start_codon:yes stop_codon:yes gene_type:complete
MSYLSRERTREEREAEAEAQKRTPEERVSPLKSITVEWYEGFQFIQSPFTLNVWSVFDKFIEYLWDQERSKEYGERTDSYGGYTKVKVRIEWENGDVLQDRIDVGPRDYHPKIMGSIGNYLRGAGVGYPPRGVMYGSSFQYDMDDEGIVTETTRDDVSWTD